MDSIGLVVLGGDVHRVISVFILILDGVSVGLLVGGCSHTVSVDSIGLVVLRGDDHRVISVFVLVLISICNCIV